MKAIDAGRFLLFVAILAADIRWKSPHQAAEAQLVRFQGLVVTTNNGQFALERGESTYTIQSIQASTTAGGTAVDGTNLWALDVFFTTGTHNSPNLSPSARIDATSISNFQSDTQLVPGSVLTFPMVDATFDLTQITCESVTLICVILKKGPTTQVFTVEQEMGCQTVKCRGTVIESVVPSILNRGDLRQGLGTNQLEIMIQLTPPASVFRSVQGMGLTQTAVFGSLRPDGTGPQIAASVTADSMNYGLSATTTSVLPVINAQLNLQEAGCNQVSYICVDVSRGVDPSPDYTLTFDPPEASVACRELSCIGVVVVSGTFQAGILGEYKKEHLLSIPNVVFSASSDGGSVGSGARWALQVAVAENADGTGVLEDTRALATISAGQQSSLFRAGSTLSFTDVTVTLDLSLYECDNMRSIVITLLKHPDSPIDFTFTGGIISMQATCRGLTITGIDVMPSLGTSNNGFPLQEFTTQQSLIFDAYFHTDTRYGSVVGSQLWTLSVGISAVPSPNFNTLPESATATLTTAQRNLDVQGGETLYFNDTQVSLSYTMDDCSGDRYFCVSINRNTNRQIEARDDNTDFMLSGQSVGCVPVNCLGVQITSIQLLTLTPTHIIEHRSTRFTMSVFVSANPDAGSSPDRQATVDLWSLRYVMSPTDTPDLSDFSRLPVVAVYTGPAEELAIEAGDSGLFSTIDVTFDLTAMCSDMQYICLVLQQAPSAQNLFIWVPEENVQYGCTRILSCSGAEIARLPVQVTAAVGVTENNPLSQLIPLRFQAVASSASSTMSSQGSNYWQLLAFGSQSAIGEGERVALREIGLSALQSSFPLRTNTETDFGEVNYDLLVNTVDCTRLGYICLELAKNPSIPGPSPDFSLVSSAVGCVSVPCRGVIISETTVTVQSGGLREGLQSNNLFLDVQLTAATSSAGVNGDNLWTLYMFTNDRPDGSGTRVTIETRLVQSMPWKDADLSNLQADLTAVDVGQHFDLRNTQCAEVPYVCIMVSKGPNPSIPFTLTPESQNSLLGCVEVTCNGFVIHPEGVNLLPAEGIIIEHSRTPILVRFGAQFRSDLENEDIMGDDLWQLVTYLNDEIEGSGNKQMAETTVTDLRGEQNQDLIRGQLLDFTDITVALPVSNYVCRSQNYFCVQLQKNPDRSFTLAATVPACTEIQCRGVLIESINIDQTIGNPFVEDADQHPIGLRVTINTNGAWAGVGGERLWRYEVFLSPTNEHTLLRHGQVSDAMYSTAREEVTAGQPTLSNVNAVLGLNDVLCTEADYICLIIYQGDQPSIEYTFEQTNPRALRACQPIRCQGVDLTELNLAIDDGSPFLEQSRQHQLTVSLDLRFSPQTASIVGSDLWDVEVFTSSDNPPTGSSDRRAQTSFEALDGNVIRGLLTPISLVPFDFDFSNSICEEIEYLCAQVSKHASAVPDFTLDPQLGVLECIEVPCRGAVIEELVIDIVSPDTLLEVLENEVTVTAMLQANAENAGISDIGGLDIWEFILFTNDNMDASGQREKESSVTAPGSVMPGETLNFDLTFQLDLFNYVCNTGMDYLCVEVRSGPHLTQGLTVAYPSAVCQPIGCVGVQFRNLVIDQASLLFLEYSVLHTVTFDLDADTTPERTIVESRNNAQGMTVSNLWQVSITADENDQRELHRPGNLFYRNATAALSSSQATSPYRSGTVFEIEGIDAVFDLSDFYCPADNYYICVTLEKSPAPRPDFTFEGTPPQSCVEVTCRGVIIDETTISISNGEFIREREFSEEVTFDLTVTSSPDGSSAEGERLWRIVTFISTLEDGNGLEYGRQVVTPLDLDYQGMDIPAGGQGLFTDVSTVMNLQGLSSCEGMLYFCAELQRHIDPSRPFRLGGNLRACTEINCRGVVVVSRSGMMGLSSDVLREGSGISELLVDFSYISATDGASVEGVNLWEIEVFANSDQNGEGINYGSSVVTLPPNGRNFALRAGETVSFSSVGVRIDFAQITGIYRTCPEIQHICGRLMRYSLSPVEFSLEADPEYATTACARFECSGVIIGSTELVVTSDLDIVEDSFFQLQFGLTLNIHSTSSNLPDRGGSNHWQVEFFGNSQSDGLGQRTGKVEVNVPDNERDKGAAQSLPTRLEGLTVAADFSGEFCNTLLYLCAEISVSPDSNPLFRLGGYLNEPERLIGCQRTSCTGVLITGGELTVPSSTRLIAGLQGHTITDFSVIYNSDVTGASITANGDALWTITVFLATNPRGDDPFSVVTANINRGQSDQALTAGQVLNFAGISATLDTRNVRCSDGPYLCTTLGKNPARVFVLAGVPDESVFTVCERINCDGVVVEDNIVTIVTPSNLIYAREDRIPFCFHLDYSFAPDGGSVTGTNLLEMEVYVSNSETGESVVQGSRLIVPGNNGTTTLAAGGSHNLMNLKAELDTRNLNCPNGFGYLCVRTRPGPESAPRFSLSGNLIGCAPIVCEGIRIEASAVELLTPDSIRENRIDQRITFDLRLTVAENSANFNLAERLWGPVRVFTATANRIPVGKVDVQTTMTFEQASTEIERGQVSFLSAINGPGFDTSETLCRDIPYFCVTLAGLTDSDGEDIYSITFLDGSETACALLPCRGVEIQQVTLLDDGLEIIERTPITTLRLNAEVESDPDGSGIAGSNLWSIQAFFDLRADCQGGSFPGTNARARDWANSELIPGQTLSLTRGTFFMFLATLVCPTDGQLYLCLEFNKQTEVTPTPDFMLTFVPDDSVRFSSVPVACQGVVIARSSVDFTVERLVIREGDPSHTFDFNFFSWSTETSAGITGRNLWELEIFGSRDETGLNGEAFLTTAPIGSVQRDQSLGSGSIYLPFPNVVVSVDLRGVRCASIPFACVRIKRDPGSDPVFSVRGLNGPASRTACHPITCAGVEVDVFVAGIVDAAIFENLMDQRVTTSLSIQTHPSAMSLIGNNYWRPFVFFNDRVDGFGPAGRIGLTEMEIPEEQRSTDLPAGGDVTFYPAEASVFFNTSCTIGEYMCFEIFNGEDLASPRATLLGNVVHCFDVDCTGLIVADTFLEIEAGVEFIEGDAAHELFFTVDVLSDHSGAGATFNPDWRLRAFLSTRDNSDGIVNETVVYDSLVSNVLSEAQEGLIFAAGSQLSFSDLQSSFSVEGVLCETSQYLCVQFYTAEGSSHSIEPLNGEEGRLVDCQPLNCIGLLVAFTTIELDAGAPLISNQANHQLEMDFTFQTASNSISLSGRRLFTLTVFPNDAQDGSGTTPQNAQVVLQINSLVSIVPGVLNPFVNLRPIISLTGIQCHEMPYICATLGRGTTPSTPYTLQPDTGHPVLTACTPMLECLGVEITELTVEVLSGLPIPEDANSHTVQSRITVSSLPNGGSVAGINLWAINVFMSPSPDGQGDRFFEASAAIGREANQPLAAGGNLTISSLAPFNLNGFSCASTPYLCHEFTKGANPNPDFSLGAAPSLPNGLIDCQEFVCDAVQFESVNFFIDRNQAPADPVPFRVHEYSASFEVSLDILVTVAPESVTVSGTDLWSVMLFYSRVEDGSEQRLGETMATLTEAQGQVQITAGQTSQLDNVLATSDLSTYDCERLQYLCIEVWSGTNASPQYGIDRPSERAELRVCRPVECIGVVVSSVEPTLSDDVPVLINRSPIAQTVTFNLSVIASPYGSGVQGNSLWEVEAYIAADDLVSDNNHDRLDAVVGTLPGGEANKPLVSGESLVLEGISADFILGGSDCEDIRFVCATLRKGQSSSPDFELSGVTPSSLTGCVVIECADAGITNTEMVHGPDSILEGDPAHTIQMDIEVTTSQFGGIFFNDPLWEFTAWVTHRSSEVETTPVTLRNSLTTAQRNVDFFPGTTLMFQGVEATLNLEGLGCGDLEAFCVRVGFQEPSLRLIGVPDDTSLEACSPVVGCGEAEVTLRVTDFDERTITILWGGGTGDFDRYEIIYSPEDGLTESPLIIPRASAQSTLVFQELNPGQLYTISLQLRKGSVTKDQPTVVQQRTRPERVTGLTVDDVDPQSIEVTWDAAGGTFDNYVISLDPRDGLPASPALVEPLTSDRRLTFRNLVIATRYTITAVTRSGNMDSIETRVNGFTTPTRPSLSAGESTSTMIQIKWIPPTGYSPDRYEITYNSTMVDVNRLTWRNVSVRETTLENLIPGTRYDISIVAVVDDNAGTAVVSPPSRTSGITVPDLPVFQDIQTNSSAITLTISLDRGSADCIQLEYRPETTPLRTSETIPYGGTPVVYTIGGLQPGTLHEIVANSKFEDIGSNRVRTEVRTAIEGPTNLDVTDITTTTISFEWDAPFGITIEDYVIHASYPGMPDFRVGVTEASSFTITGLDPYTNVDFTVRARFLIQDPSEEVLSDPLGDRRRTLSTAPGPVANAIAFQVGDQKQIQVEFDIPEMPNGELIQFDIEYRETPKNGIEGSPISNIIPVDTQEAEHYTSSVAVNINVDSCYVFTITAVNDNGPGESVTTNEVCIKKNAPSMNGLLQGSLTTQDDSTDPDLEVRFDRSLFENQDAPIDNYTAIVAEDGQSVEGLEFREPLPAYDPAVPGPYQTFAPRPWPDDGVSITVVLGEDEICGSFTYCNPPLMPGTSYWVAIRVYNEAGFITSDFVKITTPETTFWMANMWYIIIGAAVILILIILFVILVTCLCCGGRKKRSKSRSRRAEYPRSRTNKYIDDDSDTSSESSGDGLDNINLNNAATLVYNPAERSSSRASVVSHISGTASAITRPVRLQNFAAHVGQLSANDQEGFHLEFDNLHNVGLGQPSAIALTTDNKSKNRFSNILPYDTSRVILHGEDDYINASFITGFNRLHEFIATQGPMEHTANDFWRMVWEQQVPIIVMLCDIVEGGKTKCDEYWPPIGEPTACGEIRVTMLSEEETTKGIERQFKLEIGEHSRTVTHYQFLDWPDKGVPSDSKPFALFVKDIRSEMKVLSGPVVVHCSDGASRTGVFIALDTLMQALDNKADSVDVYGVVARLRKERGNMVLSKNYYVFLHQAVLDMLLAGLSDSNWSFGETVSPISRKYDYVAIADDGILASESQL